MTEETTTRRFNWRVLQHGQLPLRPDRQIDNRLEHRCTVILIWPENARPSAENSVIVDPCFTLAGMNQAAAQLNALDITIKDVRQAFLTHPHTDHLPLVPGEGRETRFQRLSIKQNPHAEGMAAWLCPGHHPLLMALAFRAVDDLRVWAVGDAVLDEEWLRCWAYYWPNNYTAPEIADTWRSVAKILEGADLIVPGHGPAIRVNAELVGDLLDSFAKAPYADQCPEVADRLRARLKQWD